MRFTLRVIPEPEPDTRAVFVSDGPDTVFIRGEQTGFVYVCGGCGVVLMRDVAPKQVVNIVLKCPACGAYNESSQIPGQN